MLANDADATVTVKVLDLQRDVIGREQKGVEAPNGAF